MNIKTIKIIKGNQASKQQLQAYFKSNGQLSIKQTKTETSSVVIIDSLPITSNLGIQMFEKLKNELRGVAIRKSTGIHVLVANPISLAFPLYRICHLSFNESC